MKKIVKFISFIIIICMLLQVVAPISSIATYNNTQTRNTENTEEYGRVYREWLELTELEKQKVLQPTKYDIPFTALELKSSEIDVPEYYNLAENIDIKVENQKSFGLCWAFAATKCLETNLALTKGEYYDFSEMHLGLKTNGLEGGCFSQAVQYWENAEGPVLDSEVEYREYELEEMDYINTRNDVKTVKKDVTFPTIYKDTATTEEIEETRKAIKQHIIEYGSVYASIQLGETEKDFENDDKVYFNEETSALYYNNADSLQSNHAISLVGWDDTYPKENFVEGNQPSKDGAYIALNSWGADWGEEGYFYISYEDLLVELDVHGVEIIEECNVMTMEGVDVNRMQEILQKENIIDLNSSIGAGASNTIYFAVNTGKYINPDNKIIEEFIICAQEGASCEIYINPYGTSWNKNELILAQKIDYLQEGINYIELDNIEDTYDEFAICVKYTGDYIYTFQPEAEKEYYDQEFSTAVYFGNSLDGNWNRLLLEYYEDDIAYIREIDVPFGLKTSSNTNEIQLGNVTPENIIPFNDNNITFDIPVSVEDVISGENELDIKVEFKHNDVTNQFDITGKNITSGSTNVKITPNTELIKGTYIIEISYPNAETVYKVLNKEGLFNITLDSYYLWDYEEWNHIVTIENVQQSELQLTEQNISITYNNEDASQYFSDFLIVNDENYSYIDFTRSIENVIPSGTYTLTVEYENYKESIDLIIGEDQLCRLELCDYDGLGVYDTYFNDVLYVAKLIDVSSGEEIIVDEASNPFANLENDVLYELRIYNNVRKERINFPYYAYSKTYLYKDANGEKYIQNEIDGELLTESTMLHMNPDGTENTNRNDIITVEIQNDLILIMDNTIPCIWEEEGTTDNIIEIDSSIPVQDYIEYIEVTPGTAQITTQDGQVVGAEEYIGTGMLLVVGDRIWEFSTYGDIDGNGDLNLTDIGKMRSHIVSIEELMGVYEMAADYNIDGRISLTDLSQMKKAIIESE